MNLKCVRCHIYYSHLSYKIITRTNGIVCCSEHENIPINMFFDTMKITIFALFGGREQLWYQSDYAAAQTDLICAFAVCKCSK